MHLGESCERVAAMGGDPAIYAELGVIAPADLLRDANAVLEANVELGAWMHCNTATTFFRPVADGEHISTRGWVSEVSERNGNHFAVLDLLTVVDGTTPAVHYLHTVAWKLRRTEETRASVPSSPEADGTT